MKAAGLFYRLCFEGMLLCLVFLIATCRLKADNVEINPWDQAYLENFGVKPKSVTRPPPDLIGKPVVTYENKKESTVVLANKIPDTVPDVKCVDKATNCGEIVKNCNSAAFAEMMTENCAKTCGFCECGDSSNSCAYWGSNGFCDSQFYSVTLKKRICGKTCQLCT
ncbi:unnamed protein product [Bursaphelenchus okinawaensis]|uniref:ShKT domain-containing protein n=1 Tax=Bursaphelenchus okinawaensis TaxID=465554 RepID=A0A811KTD9_9BILA|nr:unnamed protein product [Bursaphelenchus okinawaensis]CAG9112318.1 unnamed protein product [Bursaphelenchus okinawaensis]